MKYAHDPYTREGEPLTIEEAAATARIVERLEGTHRLLIHGRVNPDQKGDPEGMDELASRHRIAAWKTYTQWGPDAKGFFLDDAFVTCGPKTRREFLNLKSRGG